MGKHEAILKARDLFNDEKYLGGLTKLFKLSGKTLIMRKGIC
jgi:hypothetical protein